jgi:hypothetical protein
MNQNIEHLREQNRNRLIGLATEHLQLESIASAIIPIPGGDRVIAIGTTAQVSALLLDAPPPLLNADELAALRRFDECAQDGEGYDVAPEMMARLAEIGVVRRLVGRYFKATEFGIRVLEESPS